MTKLSRIFPLLATLSLAACVSRASLKIQISSQYFVIHKKCLLTYQSYAASTFFAHAAFCLNLLIFRGAQYSIPTGPSVIVLPGSGKNFEQFRHDDQLYRQYSLYAGWRKTA